MTKRLLSLLVAITVAMTVCSCQHDVHGDLFVTRKPVTFHVTSPDGTPLENVEVKSEELDAFDYDLIIDRTHYTRTDADGMATVRAAYDEEPGYSRLGERTTRFTFTLTGYAVYDTIFNHWDGTVEISLQRE